VGERILKTGYHLSNVTVKSMVAYFLITHSAEPTMKVNSNNQLYSSKKTFDSSINEEKIQKKERHTQVYAQTYQQKSYILAKLLCAITINSQKYTIVFQSC